MRDRSRTGGQYEWRLIKLPACLEIRPSTHSTAIGQSKQESRAIGGKPRDAAANLDTYRILQRHRTCGFPAAARLSCWSLSVTSTRKNQSDRILNADKYIAWSLSIATVIINHYKTKDRREKTRVLLPFRQTRSRLRHSAQDVNREGYEGHAPRTIYSVRKQHVKYYTPTG